jgi:hypothetical protein
MDINGTKICAFYGRPDPTNFLALESGTERTEHGILSTEHAACSYGLPVIVLDGRAIGPADLDNLHVSIVASHSDDLDGNEHAVYPAHARQAAEALRRAGYRLADHTCRDLGFT